jgi:hypothetical protein
MDPTRSIVTRTLRIVSLSCLASAVLVAQACSGDLGPGVGEEAPPPSEDPGDTDPGEQVEPTELDDRVVDYSEALRTASLKLMDRLPTLIEIRRVQNAVDQRAEYESLLDDMFESVEYQRRMIRWWRDTMKQGGGDLDTAPVFAARVMVEGRPFSELFTAQSGTCPGYDAATDTFVDGDCANNVPVHAGVLTNPGVMRQFYGNMAFRRVRWVQEVFACSKFPAEYAPAPVAKGAGQYTSPWDFESISDTPVDFRDVSAVICANCHTTMNHQASLFGHFDADGMWQEGIAVMTPTAPEPVTTELSHWLAAGEEPAWRNGVPTPDLPALGEAMAEDPAVKQCVVARLWNFAMSKEDIVAGAAVVPAEVIEDHVQRFIERGENLSDILRAMMKSDDFVRF